MHAYNHVLVCFIRKYAHIPGIHVCIPHDQSSDQCTATGLFRSLNFCVKYFTSNKLWIGITIRKYFQLKEFPMHMRQHSARLYRFRIISLDHKRPASRIVVCFTKSNEKEVLSSATCMAIMCSYRTRWVTAVGELLKCSREPTNASARYTVVVIKEGMTISHH